MRAQSLKNVKHVCLYFLFVIPGLILVYLFPRMRIGRLRADRLGHLSVEPDVYFSRLKRERKAKFSHVLLLLDTPVCNQYVLSLIKNLRLPGIKLTVSKNPLLKSFFWHFYRDSKFKNIFIDLASDDIQDWYERTIMSPVLFQPQASDENKCRSWLSEQSALDRSLPYVILHNRDAKFLDSRGFDYHSYRDFSPELFLPIIEKYGSKYNFIRGGSIAVEALPQGMKRVLDLPFTQHSELLDILIHREALFYFGSDSGICGVSMMFRKPIAGVCWPCTAYGFLRRCSINMLGFIPKKLVDSVTGKPISLVEMYEHRWVNLWKTHQFEQAGIKVVNNSKMEILQFFTEALEIYNSGFEKTFVYNDYQEEFWRIVTHYEPDEINKKLVLDNCFIGTDFLRRNAYLLAS